MTSFVAAHAGSSSICNVKVARFASTNSLRTATARSLSLKDRIRRVGLFKNLNCTRRVAEFKLSRLRVRRMPYVVRTHEPQLLRQLNVLETHSSHVSLQLVLHLTARRLRRILLDASWLRCLTRRTRLSMLHGTSRPNIISPQ